MIALTNITVSVSLALLLAFGGALLITSSHRSTLIFHNAITMLAKQNMPAETARALPSEPAKPGPNALSVIVIMPEGGIDGSGEMANPPQRFMTNPTLFQSHFVIDTLYLLMAKAPLPTLVIIPNQGQDLVIRVKQSHLQAELRTFFAVRFAAMFAIFMVVGLVIARIIRFLLIRPLDDLVSTLKRFGADPTISWAIPDSLKQRPEFRDAAIALDSLQRNTLLALRQRERLADIGEAVAKINHDIRNALSSAALVTDTLLVSNDPKIQRTAPHFVRSLEQAVELCQSMLDYLVEPPSPSPELTNITQLAEDLAARLDLTITLTGQREIYVDKAMLQRILTNLIRNAAVAGARNIHIDVWQAGHLGVIDIADDGPGIPPGSWNDMFLAFRTNSRGGTGLGLAISRDLAVILGGNLKLARSNENGSEFRLQLPKQIFHV